MKERALSAPSFSPPERLDEYRIVRELGRGAMGYVFLAEDTLLDRPVAVKFIAQKRPDDASKRRFFTEARAVAKLSHPNVVAVHRIGEAAGRLYLVTELVRGQSLDTIERPVAEDRLRAIAAGVAEGLAAAHRSGVLHRDIKPANVMWTNEGEVKILDFGLAKIGGEGVDAAGSMAKRTAVSSSGESVSGIVGSPLYMAPEVLAGGEATKRSDVYSTGVLLYELGCGLAPRETLPEDASDEMWIRGEAAPLTRRAPGIDHDLAAVIDRCLSPDPAARFASGAELCEALATLHAVTSDVVAIPEGNPYRGLTPFEAEHRALFFGRAADARVVVDKLRLERVVVVTGDSGVGKSSLCRAGVLPLIEGDVFGDGRSYETLTIVPGKRPVAALAGALGAIATKIRGETLFEPGALAAAVRDALGASRGLVIFVDQLEELLTIAGEGEVLPFSTALAELAASAAGVRLLMAARGDYFTRLASLPEIGDDLLRGLVVLRSLSPEGLRAAIEGPAHKKGARFEPPSLVDDLVRAAGAGGGLPLLQFALAELWDARRGGADITKEALDTMGGVEGALARHADNVLMGLSAEAREAARRTLLRLVTPEGTRIKRSRAELDAGGAPTRAALEALVRGRLLVAGEEEGETTVELGHEALIREWGSLKRWIDADKEQLSFLQQIDQAAQLWVKRGKREDETWMGDALADAERRIERWGVDLPEPSRAFFEASVARSRAAQRRRRWVVGGSAGGLILVTIASIVAAVAFAEKEREAIRQQAQIRLAAADMGLFELIIEPFDWDPEHQKASPAPAPASLDALFYVLTPGDPLTPGRRYGPEDLRRANRRIEEGALKEIIEARSGPVLVEVTGRGEGCAPSFIPIQRLPGYTERASGKPLVIRLSVPSCAASKANMVEVEGGEFYRAVEDKSKAWTWIDERATIPGFAMDRTEVTRGAFARYEAMAALTGDSAARTSYLSFDRPGGEKLPIVGVNAFTAASYCRYMGKQLPTVDQWLKAMRGGVTVKGVENPDPKRMTPWITARSKHPRNIDDPGDGAADVAFVGSFPDDESPHGILDLAGNVSEWSRDAVASASMQGLRLVLGASWDAPPAHAYWVNKRPDRYLDFTIGIRCVRE